MQRVEKYFSNRWEMVTMGKRTRRMQRKEKHRNRVLRSVNGTLSTAAGGFGFVNTEDGTEIFIPPSAMNGALDGDTVRTEITSERDERGPVGRIAEILQRGRRFMVCELLDGHKARPLNRNLSQELKISGSLKGAKKGDWVNLRLLDNGSKFTEALRGSVEEPIGKAGTVYGDLLAVAKEFDMPGPYSQEMETFAAGITPAQGCEREELADRFTVTIDPADAKDFDDALSIEDRGKEWEIGVHIADVAVYVRPGGKLDREARKRAFSSYIPGMLRPMLPHSLTSRISLRQDADSLAHSVMLRVRKRDGSVVAARRVFSRIRVNCRLNYDEVQEAIDGKTPPSWSDELKNAITMLAAAARKMRACRKRREEFLAFDTPEIRVLCDETTHEIRGMERRVQRESEKLVEECMLAANSAVAEEVSVAPMAALYRIHPEPEPEKLEEFSLFVSTLLKRMPGDLSNRKICNEFLDSLPDDHRKYVITSNFLRAMARASYSEVPGLHYGLGKSRYSHFTSPIRRYPDLVLHQQLHAAAENARLRSTRTMRTIALECSKLEERNDEAYFAAADRLKLHYLMQQHALEDMKLYEGVVVKISSQGMICDIPEYGLRGVVPNRFLHRRTKRPPRIGDFIYLYLDSLDFSRGSAVFRPTL